MKIILGSDHAGFEMKEKVKDALKREGMHCFDTGPGSDAQADYPDYAVKVAEEVVKGNRGILFCGTGIGMSIAANKVNGIRAAIAYDEYTAKMSRLHNDTNILCMRSREISFEDVMKIIHAWLSTEFSNEERHKKRIGKITKIEESWNI